MSAAPSNRADRFRWRGNRNYAVLRWGIGLTVAVAFFLVAIGVVAGSLIYGAFLGIPTDTIRPWSIIDYLPYRHVSPKHNAAFWAAVAGPPGALLAFGITIALVTVFKPKTHGDARFASPLDMRRAGLYSDTGIILGGAGSRLLRADKNTNVLLVAPPRSNKGLGVVGPNALAWPGSIVLTDIKLEIYDATAGFRAKFGDVYLYAPGEQNTARYNALDMVRRERTYRIADIQRIAHILMPAPVQGNPMWEAEARNLYLSIILYLLDTPGAVVSHGAAYRLLKGTELTDDGLTTLLAARRTELDSVCVGNFEDFLKMGDRQKSGVKSSLATALEVFADPLIDAATATSDFDPRTMFDRRMAIYLGIKPGNIARLGILFNLFIQQIVLSLLDNLEKAESAKNQVLLLLDEAPAFGRMDALKKAAAFFPGYNVRMLFVAQTLAQLDSIYGEGGRREIVAACRHRVVYAPNDANDARALSSELGTRTVTTVTKTLGATWGSRSHSHGHTGRPLLTPDQIMRLSPKKELILVEGHRPALVNKLNFLRDKRFSSRIMPAPSVPNLAVDDGVLAGLWREPLDEPAHVIEPLQDVGLGGADTLATPDLDADVVSAVANVFGLDESEVKERASSTTGWVHAN